MLYKMPENLKLDHEKIKQRIGFHPHEKQREVLTNLNRFNVIAGGKRVGKTILIAYLALKELLTSDRNVWIVAPTYDLSKRSWDYLTEWANRYFPDLFRITNAPEPKIESVYGSKLWLKSAENPKSLLGQPLDLCLQDEASRMEPEIWERYLRPNLMDRQGRSVQISNPWGKNWFYDQFLMEHHDSEYRSFHMPTAIEDGRGNIVGTCNPDNISISELERIKKTTPEHIWKQEYLAVFTEGSGQVFRNVKECATGKLTGPHPGHLYYIGVDLGRLVDFTVLTAICRNCRKVVGWQRFKDVDWLIQKARIKAFAKAYYDPAVVVDTTGLGDPIVEELRFEGLLVNEFKYGRESKRKLIDKLAILIDQKKLVYPPIPELLAELESFSFEKTDNGHVKYFSPGGKHDDAVNSLALACWKLEEDENIDWPAQTWAPKHRSFR